MNELSVLQNTRLATRLSVEKLILCEVSPFVQQYRRPYQTNASGDMIHLIEERVASANFSHNGMTPSLFSGAASNYVVPSTLAHSVNIPNGWGTSRFYFQMPVTIVTDLGTKTELVSGYTDMNDVSLGGHINPNTIFHIDSITLISHVPTTIGGNSFINNTVNASAQILTNHDAGEVKRPFDPGFNHLSMLRPSDIFSNIVLQTHNLQESTFNSATAVVNPRTSSRANTSQSDYIARILRGTFSELSNHTGQIDGPTIFSGAGALVNERSVTDFAFIKMLRESTGVPSPTSFTWSEMMRLTNGQIDQRTKILKSGSHAVTRVSDSPYLSVKASSNESDSFNGQDDIGVAAAMISNAIPSYLILCGFGYGSFRVTNAHSPSSVEAATLVWTGQGLLSLVPGHVDRRQIDRITSYIVNDLMMAVSFQNGVFFDVSVVCDVFGRLEMEIQLGNKRARFVTPTFASSIITPVLSNNVNDLNSIGGSFNHLLTEVLAQSGSTTFADEQGDLVRNDFSRAF